MDIFNKNNTSRAVDTVGTQNLAIDNFLKSITKLISNVVVKIKTDSNDKYSTNDALIFLQPIDPTELRQRIKDQIHGSFGINSVTRSLNELKSYIDEINGMSSDQQLLKDFKTADVIIGLWYDFFENVSYLSVDGQSISRIRISNRLMINVLTSDASAQYLVNLSNKL